MKIERHPVRSCLAPQMSKQTFRSLFMNESSRKSCKLSRLIFIDVITTSQEILAARGLGRCSNLVKC